jgi:hypothetical protein
MSKRPLDGHNQQRQEKKQPRHDAEVDDDYQTASGEEEDVASPLLLVRASRLDPPLWGRQFCSLELFSGRGIISQRFADRRWRVRSVDKSPRSFATDKVDFHQLQWSNIRAVPDFIWASPPSFTYSLSAGMCPI